MKVIRTRYAPSPTGHLHIGGARTALFCYLFAKHNNGDFIVRIEDTDKERNIEKGEQSQLNNLRWLGIIPDETTDKVNTKYAPYRQSERIDIYKKYIEILVKEKKAYPCYCTKEELEALKEQQNNEGIKAVKYNEKCRELSKTEQDELVKKNLCPVYRLKLPRNTLYEWEDIVRGKISFSSSDMDDFIIARSDFMPMYNFAVVIDDFLMDISHVFRGEEHISNTPKQLAIYKSLGWNTPKFGHLTIITNQEGKKLSKRDESIMQFIEQYKNNGYLPEAMFNFLSLLGWSPKDNIEIKNQKELIDAFDTDRLSKSPAKFSEEKLKWLNSEYIKRMSNELYTETSKKFLKLDLLDQIKEMDLEYLFLLFKSQILYFEELNDLIADLLKVNIFSLSPECSDFLKKESSIDILKTFKNGIETMDVWNEIAIKEAINNTSLKCNAKGKKLYMTIRIISSFATHGPELAKVIFILSKEVVLSRINYVLERWENDFK